jgi:hypothetical protein
LHSRCRRCLARDCFGDDAVAGARPTVAEERNVAHAIARSTSSAMAKGITVRLRRDILFICQCDAADIEHSSAMAAIELVDAASSVGASDTEHAGYR